MPKRKYVITTEHAKIITTSSKNGPTVAAELDIPVGIVYRVRQAQEVIIDEDEQSVKIIPKPKSTTDQDGVKYRTVNITKASTEIKSLHESGKRINSIGD